MEKKYNLKTIFHNLKFGLFGISLLLVLFTGFTIFTKSCGGNFPDRTRGPLAHKEFYELGMLPEWEDIITEKFNTNGEEMNRIEMMIEGIEYPPLEFGEPTPTPETEKTEETEDSNS